MPQELSTYDCEPSKIVTLKDIIEIFKRLSATKAYIKKLAPNDNSKNQPYFGPHLTDLSFIPTGNIESSVSTSKKNTDPKRRIKYQAKIDFTWVDATGHLYPAPNSKLIYYPQYPEVRFSGFLKGSNVNLSRWMAVEKEGRALGRWLIIGITESKKVYGYLVTPESNLTLELNSKVFTPITNVFGNVDFKHKVVVRDTRIALYEKLLEIHSMGWIPGQKLNSNLILKPYKAQNGGGYTLEAMLGISPNGFAEPDYLGWEVKQFGVKAFPLKSAKPTTLLTPEPNGGVYKESGLIPFMHKFGYPDKSGKPDRINFGGRHIANQICVATNLKIQIFGFDPLTSKMTDAHGSISLVSPNNEIAASWSFPKIMDHWKRKHSQAVYIPCMMRKVGFGTEYHFGSDIELGIGTTFEMFLSAMILGFVYYDPGIKLENASTGNPSAKRRSQFRVNHKHLASLYKKLEFINLCTFTNLN